MFAKNNKQEHTTKKYVCRKTMHGFTHSVFCKKKKFNAVFFLAKVSTGFKNNGKNKLRIYTSS